MNEPQSATDRTRWAGLLEMEARLLQIRRDLRTEIAEARAAMQQPPLPNLGTATLATLRRRWAETVAAARAAGLIEE